MYKNSGFNLFSGRSWICWSSSSLTTGLIRQWQSLWVKYLLIVSLIWFFFGRSGLSPATGVRAKFKYSLSLNQNINIYLGVLPLRSREKSLKTQKKYGKKLEKSVWPFPSTLRVKVIIKIYLESMYLARLMTRERFSRATSSIWPSLELDISMAFTSYKRRESWVAMRLWIFWRPRFHLFLGIIWVRIRITHRI